MRCSVRRGRAHGGYDADHDTSYSAENVAKFAIVTGFALLLAGIGFLVLTLRLPWRREEEEAASKAPAVQPALAH